MSRRRAMSSVRAAAPGGGTLWTPEAATTHLWGVDADSLSNFTLSGNSVQTWTDTSGNAASAIKPASIVAPLVNQETLNGLNVVSFSTNQALDISSSYFYGLSNNDYLVGIVVKFNNWQSNNSERIINSFAGAGSRGISILKPNGDNIDFVGGDDFNDAIRLNLNAKSGWGIIIARRQGTNQFLENDDDLSITGTNGSNIATIDAAAIGYYSPATRDFLNGAIAEIQILETTESIDILQGYMAHKWGLTSLLNASHPYKSTAPTV